MHPSGAVHKDVVNFSVDSWHHANEPQLKTTNTKREAIPLSLLERQ